MGVGSTNIAQEYSRDERGQRWENQKPCSGAVSWEIGSGNANTVASSKADMLLAMKDSTSVGQQTGTETQVLPHYNKDKMPMFVLLSGENASLSDVLKLQVLLVKILLRDTTTYPNSPFPSENSIYLLRLFFY